MSNSTKHLLGFTLVAVFGAAGVLARDSTYQAPSGWAFELGSALAMSRLNTAVAAYQYKLDGVTPEHSIVLQFRGLETTRTELKDQNVITLSYAPAGQYLLVASLSTLDPDLRRDVRFTTLIDGQGSIVWEKQSQDLFKFSMNGASIGAWYPGELMRGGGSSVRIFDLAGAEAHRYEFGRTLKGCVVPGDGTEVIGVAKRVISRLGCGTPGPIVWQYEIPGSYPKVAFVQGLDEDNFHVQLYLGAFLIVNTDGTVDYVFDPQELGKDHPMFGPAEFARYRPYAGATTDSVTLYDGSSTAFDIDLPTGTMTTRTIDTSAPAGFKFTGELAAQKMALVSPHSMIVRPLP